MQAGQYVVPEARFQHDVKYGERGPRGVREWGIASLLALLLLATLTATAALADPKFPALTGRIVDEAGLLSVEDKRALEAELKALEAKSTDQGTQILMCRDLSRS